MQKLNEFQDKNKGTCNEKVCIYLELTNTRVFSLYHAVYFLVQKSIKTDILKSAGY